MKQTQVRSSSVRKIKAVIKGKHKGADGKKCQKADSFSVPPNFNNIKIQEGYKSDKRLRAIW